MAWIGLGWHLVRCRLLLSSNIFTKSCKVILVLVNLEEIFQPTSVWCRIQNIYRKEKRPFIFSIAFFALSEPTRQSEPSGIRWPGVALKKRTSRNACAVVS
eukprot:Trichotokara_eunicae@DN10822_c0_g1_i1.p1